MFLIFSNFSVIPKANAGICTNENDSVKIN